MSLAVGGGSGTGVEDRERRVSDWASFLCGGSSSEDEEEEEEEEVK